MTIFENRTANRLQPIHVRIGDLGEHRPRRERHGAQPVRDDARQPGILGDLLVEVDRHRVTRSGRVPERLVRVDVLGDLGQRAVLPQRVVESCDPG